MKRKSIKPLYRAALGGLQSLHIKSYEIYQPVLGRNREAHGARDCETRWNAIEKCLHEHGSNSLIDLGSCEGYYVIKAAQAGLPFCIGVDFDQRRAFTSSSQAVLHDIPHAAFMIGTVDETLLEAMPKFDTVVFMSVLHHLMYDKGVEYCRRLMQSLHDKVGKFLIFEMGQSNEHQESWAKKMPDMGEDPHEWIKEFLVSVGFQSVETVALTRSFLGEVDRALFKAIP